MNRRVENQQIEITYTQREEEERNSRGEYSIEKSIAEAKVREVEQRLKVIAHRINTWKETKEENFKHNEYFDIFFGEECLKEQKEELKIEYRKRRGDEVAYWIKRE